MAYKFLPHTADIKFQASANTLKEAFTESVMALKQIIAENIKVNPKERKQISIKGNDLENLLYNFLEEFLYLLDAEDFLLSRINKIKIDENTLILKAIITGDKASNYKFTNNVKAVTYNDMFVKKEKDKYVCQVVLDV